MIKIKENKFFNNLNKKFDREMHKRINVKETIAEQQLYNIILSAINNKITLALDKEYCKDMKNILSDEILDTIKTLQTMNSTQSDVMEYRDKKIDELRRLYEQVNDLNNGNQSEQLSL